MILGAFVLYPLARAFWLGHQRCDPTGANCRSNGWDQYIGVFRSEEFQQALGVTVKPEYLTATSKTFTDRSVVFRIRGVGAAGDVTKTIDAVVTYDPSQLRDPVASQAQAQAQAGRLIHWRQE